jgi:hypothetical protein
MRLKQSKHSIMAKKIKALRTISGSYGKLETGSTVTVSDHLAEELAEVGLVEIEGDSTEDEADSEAAQLKRAEISVRVKGGKNGKVKE